MRVSDDTHVEAVAAFWDAWRENAALPEDERSGIAVAAALAVLPEPQPGPLPERVAKLESELSAVVCALDDADVPGVVGVDGPVLDCVNRPAVVLGETCGAPGRIKWLANQLEFYRGATEHAEKLIKQLREKVAPAQQEPLPDRSLMHRELAGVVNRHGGQASYEYVQALVDKAVELCAGRIPAEVSEGGMIFQVTEQEWRDLGMTDAPQNGLMLRQLNRILSERQPDPPGAPASEAARPGACSVSVPDGKAIQTALAWLWSAYAAVPPGLTRRSIGHAMRALGETMVDDEELAPDEGSASVAVPQGEPEKAAIQTIIQSSQTFSEALKALTDKLVSGECQRLQQELFAARHTIHQIADVLGLVERADGTDGFRQAPDWKVVEAASELVRAHRDAVDMSIQQRQQLDRVADVLGLECEPSEVDVAAIDAVGKLRAELHPATPDQPASADQQPASLREVWAAIGLLGEALIAAHARDGYSTLRAPFRAQVVELVSSIDARKGGGG